MSESAVVEPVPADVDPVALNRADRRAADRDRDRAESAVKVRCNQLAAKAGQQLMDPAVTADDIAVELYVLAGTGTRPNITIARRLVADVNVAYTARSARETKAAVNVGAVAGRRRRVSRLVARLHAVQIARQIVERGPALTAPTSGPGYAFRAVVESGSYWLRSPTGPRVVILDRCRYESARPGTVETRRSRLVGPAIPVGPATFGNAVKFSTVVQAILADGPTQRPDVDTARWSARSDGFKGRTERESTVAVTRFPNREIEPVTAETTARHQIRHGADKGPVRLQREPRLTRMLDKRNCYAPRVEANRELSADIPRDLRPDVDGIHYRSLLTGFLMFQPVTGGRGLLETINQALIRNRTTIGLIASDNVKQDSDTREPQFSAINALRQLELPTTGSYQKAIAVAVVDATRYADRVSEQLSLSVPVRPGYTTTGPARPMPRYGPLVVGNVVDVERFNRSALPDLPLPTVEPAPTRRASTLPARPVRVIDRVAAARSAEWFRFWSQYGPVHALDVGPDGRPDPAAARWFRNWYGRAVPVAMGPLPAGFFPPDPLTVTGRPVADGPARPVPTSSRYRAGFERGRDAARTGLGESGTRWTTRHRNGSYVGWIV